MIARRDGDFIVFTFSGVERKVLERSIRALIDNYQVEPSQIDAKTASVWYSTRGCQSAQMSGDETSEWLKSLQNVRLGRIELLKKSLEQLTRRAPGPFTLGIPISNAETLMTALNDHRLLLAAQNDIGESEMNIRSLVDFVELAAPRQTALCEIQFLAYLIEELIQLLGDSS